MRIIEKRREGVFWVEYLKDGELVGEKVILDAYGRAPEHLPPKIRRRIEREADEKSDVLLSEPVIM